MSSTAPVVDYDLFLKAFLTWDFANQEARVGKPYLYALFLRIFEGLHHEIVVEKFGDCVRNIACQMLKEYVPNGNVDLLRRKMRSTKAPGPGGKKVYAVPYCTLRRPSSYDDPNVRTLCMRLNLNETNWQERLCGWSDEWLLNNPCVDPTILRCKLQKTDPNNVPVWLGPQGASKRHRQPLLDAALDETQGPPPSSLLQPGPPGMPTPTLLHKVVPALWNPTDFPTAQHSFNIDLSTVGAGVPIYHAAANAALPIAVRSRTAAAVARQRRQCPQGPAPFLRVVHSAAMNHAGVRIFVPGDHAMYTLHTEPAMTGPPGSTIVEIGLQWPEPMANSADFVPHVSGYPHVVKWQVTVHFPVSVETATRYAEITQTTDTRTRGAPSVRRQLPMWAVYEWRRPSASAIVRQQRVVERVPKGAHGDLGIGQLDEGLDPHHMVGGLEGYTE